MAGSDVETQKRGTIILVYNLGAGPNSGAELRGLQRIGRSFPCRMAALHACVDDAKTKMVIDVSILMTGTYESTRYRCHSGSDIEVQYALSTFGIPNRLLPINGDGSIDKSQNLAFLKQVRVTEDVEMGSPAPEASDGTSWTTAPSGTDQVLIPSARGRPSKPARYSESKTTEFVMVPSELDVLLGRGRAIQEHTGNLRCRQLVASYRDQYDRGTKTEKTDIIRLVVEGVHKWGGRFLERSDDGAVWSQVTDDHARYKISHGFRNHKRLAAQKHTTIGRDDAVSPTSLETEGFGRRSPSNKRTAGNDQEGAGAMNGGPRVFNPDFQIQQGGGGFQDNASSTKKLRLD
jgi:hypothetical protein